MKAIIRIEEKMRSCDDTNKSGTFIQDWNLGNGQDEKLSGRLEETYGKIKGAAGRSGKSRSQQSATFFTKEMHSSPTTVSHPQACVSK